MSARQLGTFAADESRDYRFEVRLNANAGNAAQGKGASVDYRWDAVQVNSGRENPELSFRAGN